MQISGLRHGLYQSSGNGFQRREFPFLSIAELSPSVITPLEAETHHSTAKENKYTPIGTKTIK
jgi:hypothetical protein